MNHSRPDQSGSTDKSLSSTAVTAHVVVALDLEAGAERAGRLAHHPDVAVGGGDHGAVEVVEVEVAAAREVVERVPVAGSRAAAAGSSASRSSVSRIEHREARALDPDADRHDPRPGGRTSPTRTRRPGTWTGAPCCGPGGPENSYAPDM